MAKDIEVKVPDIGNYSNVPVIELLVAEGDTVEAEQPLMVLESDKATMEVPAPAAGVIRGLKLKVGDTVSQGDVICLLAGDGTGDGRRETEDATATETSQVPASAPMAATPVPATAQSSAASAPDVSRLPSPVSHVEARVPDIGNYQNVPVIEVLVADGDAVEAEQTLVVLESDKATLEVPAPAAGVVSGLALKVGSTVSQGDLICLLTPDAGRETGDATATAQIPAPAPTAVTVVPATVPAPAPSAPDVSRLPSPVSRPAVPYAGPATRLYARKLGVDLAQVKGSGPRGRIVIEDVQGFVKARMSAPAIPAISDSRFPIPAAGGIPPIPAIDFTQFGPIETQPLARIRKLSAAHLHRCWVNVPHVTQTDEADITELEDFRKAMGAELAASGGPKLTLLPFVIKAVATAMKQYPEFNASLAPDGESLILKQYCNIGFAADTPNGLVVPVIRDVWSKSISQLAAQSAELAKKARDGKLKPADMSGGCFSISSLGGIGGSHFTPIVNAPEVGILGVSRSQIKPVWDGKAFQPRLLCPLSLSYDHRVIDGAYAARFIVLLGRLLGDIRRLTL